MTASIEHLHGLHYRLTQRIPLADMQGVFERELRRQSRAAESLQETRQRLGRQAWEKALDTARDVAYEHALKQSELRPVNEAQFEWLQRPVDDDAVFTATFEVLPPIDLAGLAAVEIEQPSIAITDADVTRALELLRSEHKTFRTVERAAQLGDRVVFDFDGTRDGASFEGSTGQAARAVIGAGDVLDDMEVALIGRSAKDVFDALITFPDDYATPSLRGQSATFQIAVQTVAAPVFPDLDEAFVRQLGIESGSLEALRDQLHERLASDCERRRQRYERQQLADALLEAVLVTVPDTLLEHEYERLRTNFQADQPADAPDTDESGLPPEAPLRATAARRVSLSLILSEIIREHDIRLDETRVEQRLDALAARFALADAEATKRQYRDDPQVMHNVRALIIEEQGFEAALQTVRRVPVTMTLDALLEAQAEA